MVVVQVLCHFAAIVWPLQVTSGEDVYTCLMVRKEGGRQFLVRMSRDAPSVELLARTTDEFMHR